MTTTPAPSHSSNTKAVYDQAWSRFEGWCQQGGRTALPCTGETLAAYAEHLIRDRHMAPASLRVHVAAVRSRHADGNRPSAREASRLIAKWKTQQEAAGHRQQSSPALTELDLSALVATCSAGTLRDLRDAAMVTLALAICGQAQHMAALKLEDLEIANSGVSVRSVGGMGGFAPRTGHPLLDPVAAVQAWVNALADRDITRGLAFPLVDGRDVLHPETPSTRHSMRQIMQRRAKLAGLGDRSVTFQSLRASSFSARGDAGFNEAAIGEQGLWLPVVAQRRYVAQQLQAEA